MESDKSSVEVPSPFEGKISELKVKIGDRVSEGSILATLDGGKEKEIKSEPKEVIKKEEKRRRETIKWLKKWKTKNLCPANFKRRYRSCRNTRMARLT